MAHLAGVVDEGSIPRWPRCPSKPCRLKARRFSDDCDKLLRREIGEALEAGEREGPTSAQECNGKIPEHRPGASEVEQGSAGLRVGLSMPLRRGLGITRPELTS